MLINSDLFFSKLLLCKIKPWNETNLLMDIFLLGKKRLLLRIQRKVELFYYSMNKTMNKTNYYHEKKFLPPPNVAMFDSVKCCKIRLLLVCYNQMSQRALRDKLHRDNNNMHPKDTHETRNGLKLKLKLFKLKPKFIQLHLKLRETIIIIV